MKRHISTVVDHYDSDSSDSDDERTYKPNQKRRKPDDIPKNPPTKPIEPKKDDPKRDVPKKNDPKRDVIVPRHPPSIIPRKRTREESPLPRKDRSISPKRRKLDDDDDDDDDDDMDDFISFISFINSVPFATNDPPKVATGSNLVPIQPKKSLECRNPLCNHKTFEEDPTPVPVSTITTINNIDDLIALGKTYHCKKNTVCMDMNLRLLCNLIAPLTELHNMIGMKSVKKQMVDQILFFLRGMNKKTRCGTRHDCAFSLPCAKNQEEMLHTVITGSPGVGKTKLGKILGKVYKEMGILANGNMKVVSRPDLIAEYLGQTAIKTQKVIDSCKGGVLFIDEAYSLGNPEGRDSFSKECIDTLNKNLSEKRDFLCIIAGYKGSLESCFFKYNEGLTRRFTFRYDIEGYDADELYEMFCLNARTDGWKVPYEAYREDSEEYIKSKETVKAFFANNNNAFPNFGGDIETLFLMCKIANSRSLETGEKFMFSIDNIRDGFDAYLKNRDYKGSKIESIYSS